jgi:phosphoribosylaminoimidazole-succinocarboxamide synthase
LGLLQDDASTPGEVFDMSAHRSRLRTSPKPKK